MKIDRKNKAAMRRIGWLRGLCAAAAILLIVVVLVAFSVFAYVYHHIDYTADEALFSMAQGSHTTRLYYNATRSGQTMIGTADGGAARGLPVGYTPVEWETQRIRGTTNSIWCPYADIPQALKDAFVAIEDKRYFQHDGVDWLRTAKAAANYLLKFDGRFGGSTITQQLVKNVSAEDDITITRKLREMCRAIHLEQTHSKEEILELYLNVVPMSQGCTGIGAAAELYFGKQPSQLSLGECAAIAAVTNSPVRYDPYSSPEGNRARRMLILREMYEAGMIGEAEYQQACEEPLALRPLEKRQEPVYDWYTETVLSDVRDDLMAEKGLSREMAERLLYNGGLQIYTQMDMSVQNTLTAYFEEAGHFPSACQQGLCYAMTICDPYTGDLLAIASSVGKKQENRLLNYAARATRAPGSAIKPLSVYAPALEEGLISWASVFDDVPLQFFKRDGRYTAWPHNSPAVYQGLTDIQDAVAYSKNTVAVRVLERLGVERSYAYLSNRLGLSTLVRGRATAAGGSVTDLAAAPLALGQLTDGVSVRELTNAYGSLAGGGVYHPSRSYCLVLDGKGNVLLERKAMADRVFSEETACIMTKLLQGVTNYGTAKRIQLDAMVETAGKTGTSGEKHDKWFVGYTPYYVAGIWCGYDNGSTEIPDELVESHLAVWDAVMQAVHRPVLASRNTRRQFRTALGVVQRSYCKDSGLLPCEACRADVRTSRVSHGYFTADSLPRQICDCHVMVRYDVAGGGLARGGCPTADTKEVGMLRLPERDFPMELYVGDAQYGYRDLGDALPSEAKDRPFYEGLLSPGHCVGISRTADGRQFNILCPLHGEEPFYEDEIGEDNPADPFAWLWRRFAKHRQKE